VRRKGVLFKQRGVNWEVIRKAGKKTLGGLLSSLLREGCKGTIRSLSKKGNLLSRKKKDGGELQRFVHRGPPLLEGGAEEYSSH